MKKFFLPLVFLVFSASAFARSDNFNYSAADLSSPASIEALHHEIKQYARGYCNKRMRRSAPSLVGARSCVKSVEEEIVSEIDDRHLAVFAETGSYSGPVAAG